MKHIFISACILFICNGCMNKTEPRFKTSSPEIDLIKKGMMDYENANWKEWAIQYDDSAKIYQNSWSEFETPQEVSQRHDKLIAQLSKYSFKKDELFLEQIIDDRGRTWVNFWGLWSAVLKANGKVIEIPVHIDFQFINGKIIQEYGYWDTAQLNEELRLAEFAGSGANK